MRRVIGVGNPLRGDDGLGPALVARLAARALPPGVEARNGGAGGWALLSLMEGADEVILVDAADLGRPPGTVVRLDAGEPGAGGAEASPSAHHVGLGDVLALGRELGVLARVVVFLVQGARFDLGEGLSPAVEAALGSLEERVLAEALGDEAPLPG